MTDTITLESLGGGAAGEKFQDELDRVVENIQDPNTEAKAKRSITIKVIFTPTVDRSMGQLHIEASSKLAATIAFETQAFFGQQDGTYVAREHNPNQMTLDDAIVAAKEKQE